jgi:hypothetical protein
MLLFVCLFEDHMGHTFSIEAIDREHKSFHNS